ncbi:MAG: hypothetical protein WA708_10425 [Acidobacteriaceae bacterium]
MAMRLGTEDKKKRLIAMIFVPLALTAISYIVWELVGGPSYAPPPTVPAAGVYRPSAGATGPSSSTNRAAQHLESASALDPTLHPERMALAENTKYTGTSRNIFSKDSLPPAAMNAIEKPIASVRTAGPSGPPPPPPINLKFYGFATEQNGRKLIFLLDGEDVFIAGQGDIVDGRYKVVRIENGSVVIDDLSYNNEQTLPLQTS